ALPKQLSAAARASSYADADLEHDGGADDRRARRRSDERQYPRFADRRNWNTDPHPRDRRPTLTGTARPDPALAEIAR
ncbi:MAG TPA: hypothetical protein VFP27_18835, partial [Mycobacterium sp.]|nr:hypothetical protein [Mycobacterium sp.]